MIKSTVASLCVVGVIAVTACADNGPPESSGASPDGGVGAEGGGAPSNDEGGGPVQLLVDVSTKHLTVDGTAREYELAVPKNQTNESGLPLVLVFHGDGGSGPSLRDDFTFDAATGSDAIVAYPSGSPLGGADPGDGWDLFTPSDTNADMKFIDALVKDLSSTFRIDPNRIFATGYSSGGFFINQYACRHTGFFRALVSFEGGAPDETNGDPAATKWPSGLTKCNGQTGGIAAMIVHGDADQVVTPDSGDFNAQYWASINGCADTRTDTTPAPCKQSDGCPTDKPVLYCLIPGLAHVIWSDGAKNGWAFMKQL